MGAKLQILYDMRMTLFSRTWHYLDICRFPKTKTKEPQKIPLTSKQAGLC